MCAAHAGHESTVAFPVLRGAVRVTIAYLAMIVIWSTVALAVKWSIDDVGYAFAAAARFGIAALFIALVVFARREPIPMHRQARITYALSAINFGGFYFLVLGRTTCAVRLDWRDLWQLTVADSADGGGLVRGTFAHSGKTCWPGTWSVGDDCDFWHGLRFRVLLCSRTGVSRCVRRDRRFYACLGKARRRTFAFIADRGNGDFCCDATVFRILGFTDGVWPASGLKLRSILAICYMAIIGTGIVFVLFYYVLKHVAATQIALIGMIAPVISLLLGSMVNDEPFSPRIWTGTGIIVFALLLHEYLPRRIAGRRICRSRTLRWKMFGPSPHIA